MTSRMRRVVTALGALALVPIFATTPTPASPHLVWRRTGMDRPALPHIHRLPWRRTVGAVVGLSLTLVAGCAPPSPTTTEVLDGAAYAQPRSLAVQEVAGVAESLSSVVLSAVTGVKEAEYKKVLRCLEGQNSLKVHDGFLFHCDAVQTTYYGWRGSFNPTASALNAELATRCSVDSAVGSVKEPARGILLPGAEYPCGGEVRVAVQWGRPATLDFGPTGDIDERCSDPLVRCGSGQTSEQIGRALHDEDWILGVTVFEKYHTEWVK